ncbi:MAG TPA: murein biosynthesis integral membrane protein MurJ [Acidimicrobiales bacterium]|nr:murein biosynthesis integral membrane protein MurJ [Acidimicrobiales bacterium]
MPRDRRPADERVAEHRPTEDGTGATPPESPAEPGAPRGSRRRVPPDPERNYGEANRRHARQFALGRARRPGAGKQPAPIPGWYEPGAATVELPVVDDVFGLTAESPGVANQPLAPWLTGEHARVDVEPEPTAAEVAPEVSEAPEASGARATPPVEAAPEAEREALPSSQRSSMLVAAGIFLSRCSGLIRESVIANYLGTGPASDAFRAALRIPNLLQNLLGEGVLSASFIPVYARLRAEGREEEAGRVAGAVAGLLVALTGVLSVVGVLLAEPLTRLLVPGFNDAYRFDLTVQLVRIMFPGIGFLVLSAWCLGVLNSHRRFFLSYVAPVLWNAAQIAALVAVGLTTTNTRTLAYAVSWGVLIGGILQFGVQIGPVSRLLGGVRLNLDTANASVRSVLARFGPVVMGRGVVQIMGYVDLLLASYLATGSVASLQYALVLYLLPISLFGMSVAAAELPELSEVEVHDPETRRRFRLRLEEGMARIAWYVAPTATMFIVVGDVIVRAVFQRGNFTSADTIVVWLTLAVFSMSLLASTSSRLLQNGLYALDDARTPARVAAMSVVLAAVIGLVFMFPLDRLVVGPDGIEGWGDIFAFGPLAEAARDNAANVAHLGIVGLAVGAAVSRWFEYRLLSRALAWRIGRTRLAGRWLNPIARGCAAAAIVAVVAEALFGELPSLVALVLVLGPAGLVYVAVTRRLGVPEATIMVSRVAGLVRRARH